jgi:DNA-directed RNA polymerase subunit RPC12/RpoP
MAKYVCSECKEEAYNDGEDTVLFCDCAKRVWVPDRLGGQRRTPDQYRNSIVGRKNMSEALDDDDDDDDDVERGLGQLGPLCRKPTTDLNDECYSESLILRTYPCALHAGHTGDCLIEANLNPRWK